MGAEWFRGGVSVYREWSEAKRVSEPHLGAALHPFEHLQVAEGEGRAYT